MALDPTTPIGKVRLRIGDWSDLPILPDAVIASALEDCQNNVVRAASLSAQYVLATLTAKTHKKLSQIEVWSSEQFDNYVKFLKLTVLNPHLASVAPVPYVGERDLEHPLQTFMDEWKAGYSPGTVVIPKQTGSVTVEYELS